MNSGNPEHETADERNSSESQSAEQQPGILSMLGTIPSWATSFVLHVILILLLAFIFLPDNSNPPISFDVSDVQGQQLENPNVDLDTPESGDDAETAEEPVKPPIEIEDIKLPELEPAVPPMELTDLISETPVDLSQIISSSNAEGELSARSEAGRAAALAYGATTESEQSVDLALKWLADHQLPSGAWNFDHARGPGVRSRLDTGMEVDSPIAATSLALLPFLGAGNTHQVGQYKDVVNNGLTYLKLNAMEQETGRNWSEPYSLGRLYSHGFAAIVLCELYAMSGDQSLKDYAQDAVRFIEFSQDLRSGGWKYKPRVGGDTSVLGWQVMALKSAKLGGLKVKDSTWKLVDRFLDGVSTEYGGFYGYESPPSMSALKFHKAQIAIGLLCRMYRGWGKDHPGIQEGVRWMSEEVGPSMGTRENVDGANMYYNYYATQVMRHYGGEEWEKWNTEMRDFLVSAQDTQGAERGSWFFSRSDDISPPHGGRLYCTAMAAMTLEIYYRFQPLYSKAAEDDFPLE